MKTTNDINRNYYDRCYNKWDYEDYSKLVSCFMNKLNMEEIGKALKRSPRACWTCLNEIKDTEFYNELVENIKQQRKEWVKNQNKLKEGICYIKD